MAKAFHSNKQTKKQAVLSPSEKKARKLAKKQAGDGVGLVKPIIAP